MKRNSRRKPLPQNRTTGDPPVLIVPNPSSLSRMDQMILANAAGILAVASNNLRRLLKRLPRKDRAARDLCEMTMTLVDDSQMLSVLVAIPTKEQWTVPQIEAQVEQEVRQEQQRRRA